jgi:sortase A
VILAVLGIAIIIFSIYPIVEYEYISRSRFPKLISPVSNRERYLVLFAPQKDYKNIKNWSSEYELSNMTTEGAGKYFLSIPKLGIKDASVFEGGEDLSKSLIQYPGTARPGQIGDTVIFGHSVLPVFFNPKNYMTIFSTIPKLKSGDEIFVNIENVVYKYQISEMFEVEPDNLDIPKSCNMRSAGTSAEAKKVGCESKIN